MYNCVGTVRCYEDETDAAIDVEFHDRSLHRPVHVDNEPGYNIASLSTTAIVLAVGKVDDDEEEEEQEDL